MPKDILVRWSYHQAYKTPVWVRRLKREARDQLIGYDSFWAVCVHLQILVSTSVAVYVNLSINTSPLVFNLPRLARLLAERRDKNEIQNVQNLKNQFFLNPKIPNFFVLFCSRVTDLFQWTVSRRSRSTRYRYRANCKIRIWNPEFKLQNLISMDTEDTNRIKLQFAELNKFSFRKDQNATPAPSKVRTQNSGLNQMKN